MQRFTLTSYIRLVVSKGKEDFHSPRFSTEHDSAILRVQQRHPGEHTRKCLKQRVERYVRLQRCA